jgi:hypothetical protein
MKTLIDLLVKAIEADSAISEWCDSNYSAGPYITVGVAQHDAPSLANSPAINIFPFSRRKDQSQNYYIYGLGVHVAIIDDTTSIVDIKREDAVVGHRKTYQGIERIDEFARMVEKTVTKTMNANGYASVQSDDLADVCEPPFFMAAITYAEVRVSLIP